jgi:GNAT superfamily N-acetyltransferase
MVRRARPEDAKPIGDVFVAARAGMTYLPRQPSDDGFRDFIAGEIMRREEVWVAERDGLVRGFVTLEGELLDHIYVYPDAQGQGTGATLLDVAKSRRPHGFHLWVFQKNEGARRFYERHGLTLVEITDGQGNMEREPDARYEWVP